MTLPASVLAELWDRLEKLDRDGFLRACGEVNLSDGFATAQSRRYRSWAEAPCDRAHLHLIGWLTWRCGRRISSTSAISFDAGLPTVNGGSLVAPGWVLGIAGPGSWRQRLPCRFLVEPEDESLAEAYNGLVEHVRALQLQSPPGELMLTSVLWRIGAILDGLEDHPESAATSLGGRVSLVEQRVAGCSHFAGFEREAWKSIGTRFADRRNVLSHLIRDKPGLTFANCVQGALAEGGSVVLTAAAAISLAVAQQISTEFEADRPLGVAKAVESEMRWIEPGEYEAVSCDA